MFHMSGSCAFLLSAPYQFWYWATARRQYFTTRSIKEKIVKEKGSSHRFRVGFYPLSYYREMWIETVDGSMPYIAQIHTVCNDTWQYVYWIASVSLNLLLLFNRFNIVYFRTSCIPVRCAVSIYELSTFGEGFSCHLLKFSQRLWARLKITFHTDVFFHHPSSSLCGYSPKLELCFLITLPLRTFHSMSWIKALFHWPITRSEKVEEMEERRF